MAYTYEQVFAADPSNPSNVAQNASVTIFAPGDSSMTPLTITDPDGQPLSNPIPVNANGFGSAFAHATLDRVAWAGGGFTGYFTSYEGMKQVALDAQAAAEDSAAEATAAIALVAAAAIAPTDAAIDAGIVRADVPAIVADVVATDPTVVNAAASRALTDAELAKTKTGTTAADGTGGFVDGTGYYTWLTHTATGGPTAYAKQRITADILEYTTTTRTAWGHSLVQGNTGGATPWTTPLATLLGAPVVNRGVGGQWSRHIAARQGGKPAMVTATGGSIPASGAVDVHMDIDLIFATGSSGMYGSIAGIPGLLWRTTADGTGNDGGGASGNFTRTTSGTAKAIPNGAPFIPDNGKAARSDIVYLWPARNDLFKTGTSPAQAVENTARMIEYLAPATKKILIFEEPPGASEVYGSAGRIELDAYNTAIRNAFPQYWVPLASWMLTPAAATAAGITFTPQDNIDITNGVTPTSFRVDTIHYNTAGNVAAAARIYQEEIKRGWAL